MPYRNEKKWGQNSFWGQNPHGGWNGLQGMWNPYPVPNTIQTYYQNRSPQNPSMGMPQGYLADSYIMQMDMMRQDEVEREHQRDLEYWRQMYPEKVRKMQAYVIEMCDKEDYDDSFIYDEYPDNVSIQNMIQQIWERLQEEELFKKEILTEFKDMISILLFEELHRRRCRKKNFKRRWY